ncbi:hypothetical protein ESCOMMO184M_23275 [Escherichia coli]
MWRSSLMCLPDTSWDGGSHRPWKRYLYWMHWSRQYGPVARPAQSITVIKVLSMYRWPTRSGLRKQDYWHLQRGDADDFLDISGDDTCLLKKKKSAPLSFISNKVRSWLPSYANWAPLRKEICGVGSVHGKPVAEQKNPFVIRPVTQMSKTGCR